MLHDDGLRRQLIESRPSPKIVASVAKSKCDWRSFELGRSAARLLKTLRFHSIVIDSSFVPYHFATFPDGSRRGLPRKRNQRNSPSKRLPLRAAFQSTCIGQLAWLFRTKFAAAKFSANRQATVLRGSASWVVVLKSLVGLCGERNGPVTNE